LAYGKRKKPDRFSQLWKYAPKNVRKVITASWRVFYTTKTLTESGKRGGKIGLKVPGSAISAIRRERFDRSTRLPPPHDAVRSRVFTSMPGMSAGHLVAPVVAYKCVLQPVLCRFVPFPTKNASSQQG